MHGEAPGLARLLDRGLRIAAVALLSALLAAVVIGVVSRQAGSPVTWSDEAAQYLLVWTGFVGMMIAARRREHIRITVLVDRLPAQARRGAEVLIQLAVLCFALALLLHGWRLIGRNWDVEWVSLPLPAGLLYVPVPFAALLLAGQALGEIAAALGRGPGGRA
jgi:TRAP-type C4-dicarboxylate transport system permease small subunit